MNEINSGSLGYSVSPLELLNLYFSDGKSSGNKQSKLWRRFNKLLTWDAILDKGYQADLCPLLYYILTKWLPAHSAKRSAVSNPTKSSNSINAINAINSINLSPDCERVPDDILVRLKDEYRWSLARNMILFDELGRVLNAFNEAGIEVIVLKGAALAQTIYPDIALRPMGDLDLLVTKKDIQSAEKVLFKMGYSNKFVQTFRRTFIDEFHYTYYKKEIGQPFVIEVHWDLVHRSHYVSIDLDQVWNKAVRNSLLKIDALTLHVDYLLPYLCWHVGLHGFQRLLWLCDVALIVKNLRGEIDWNLIFQKSKEWKILRRVLFTLYLMEIFYGVTVDTLRKDKLNSLNRKVFNYLVLKLQNKNLKHLKDKIISGLLSVLLIDNQKDRIKFLLSNISELNNIRKSINH